MPTINPVDRVRELLRERPPHVRCLVCRDPVRRDEASVRLRGGGSVHRQCATYRMRQVATVAVPLDERRR